jgi:hypothetical protein
LKIVKSGASKESGQEIKPPLLSTEGALLALCTKVENNVPYEALTPGYFKHSMKGLGEAESLKERIKSRYAHVRNLSPEQIAEKGVGFTLFQILGTAEAK